VHLNAEGCVTKVTVLKPITWDPPWPEWERAIPEAFEQHCFEPTFLEGEAVPVIMSITMSIHWGHR